ncbi:MAG: CapA family protein [Eubacteriales bacterium]|nr:CapA family protein [Eubacteriales bacterium]
MKFTAAGDALIQRRIPQGYEGMKEVRDFVLRGDARFFNLETTLNREGECFASQFSGGTYLRADPEVFGDLLAYGFNLTSFNNNHAMDFSYEGLLKTREAVASYGVVQSGAGRNLAEASAPAYLETPGGRVALIAVNSTFHPAMMAGEQSRRVPGRPGINGLRFEEILELGPEDFEKIREIGEKTGVNVQKNITRAEGYGKPAEEGVYELGPLRFTCGTEASRHTAPNREDMARVEKAIFEAQLQADYIMISVHSHELAGRSKETPSEFLETFARRCIDAGADAVIGHGPHLLRPIEIYKNRPIFYSLGDFVLQLYNVALAPEDFYRTQGLTSDSTVHELLKKRSAGFTRGLMEDRRMAQTVVPYWETRGGELTRLELLPVTLSMDGTHALQGLPQKAENADFIERLAAMSAPYGTKMTLRDGIVRCEW